MNRKDTSSWLKMTLGCSALLFALQSTAKAEYTSIENEEWYDPSDWFDGDNYDYEVSDDLNAYWKDNFWDDYTYNPTWDRFDWSTAWSYDYDGDSELTDLDADYIYDRELDTWIENPSAYYTGYAYLPYGYAYTFNNDIDILSNDGDSGDASMNEQKGIKKGSNLHTFKGSVQSFLHADLRDRGQRKTTYSLAKVELQDGRTIVMSLGEKNRLERLNLEKGDPLRIKGTTGRVGEHKVIIAREVSANGATAKVNGRIAKFEGHAAEKQSETKNKRMRLSGTVEDFAQKRISGARESAAFVRIELESGDSATVLLGSEKSLSDLDLNKGDSVEIQGERKMIEGKTVLHAQSIKIDGDRVSLTSR